jgi:hypothetical protein
MGGYSHLQKFSLKKAVGTNDHRTAAEFLARHTDISKRRIKDAMNKGAVWLKKANGKQNRIRRARRPALRIHEVSSSIKLATSADNV